MAPTPAQDDDSGFSRMEAGRVAKDQISNSSNTPVSIAQKAIAEFVGTYILIFAGCGSVVANKVFAGAVTFPGICLTWGLTVMALVYTVGHVSGAHFNPAVTLTLAAFRQFPWKQVFFYVIAQVLGSILASWTLDLMFNVTEKTYFGTLPAGSVGQTLVMEIIVSFVLMFVVLGATTDGRSIGQMGGVAVGMTVALDVLVAGQVSGASMNPARSIGPAIVKHEFRALWAYIFGPVAGMMIAGLVYSLLRHENDPFADFPKFKP
ncbi:probable aquaporin NIP-type isoform X2 [Andrographis paniculata]|uniref:probable aquaporin NIP-type isoform X2 n=1 Tax=Andrographis paniculata TaxID=175694 RepID=UPI0021E85D36|nr:probable aquaporin NIP-type isoform X2 [Andrographis paniculata]